MHNVFKWLTEERHYVIEWLTEENTVYFIG